MTCGSCSSYQVEEPDVDSESMKVILNNGIILPDGGAKVECAVLEVMVDGEGFVLV